MREPVYLFGEPLRARQADVDNIALSEHAKSKEQQMLILVHVPEAIPAGVARSPLAELASRFRNTCGIPKRFL